MLELGDASPLARDGDALRERLAEDGALFFRGLLDRSDVEPVRADILRAVASVGWTAPGTDPLDAVPDATPRVEDTPNWWDGYRAVQSVESFHQLGHHPRITDQLATIFDDDVLVHPRKIARIIWPGDPTITTPAHQDFTHIGGTVDFFTLWVPLHDTPSSVGGLRVLLGSQTGGVRSMKRSTGAGGYRSEVDEDDPRWASVDYRAGDAILFHSLVVHGGRPNTSARLRVSADYRYQPAQEPIAPLSLIPHFYENGQNIPPWDTFTGGWTTTDWVKAPHDVRVSTPAASPREYTTWLASHAGDNGGRSRFVDSSTFVEQIRS